MTKSGEALYYHHHTTTPRASSLIIKNLILFSCSIFWLLKNFDLFQFCLCTTTTYAKIGTFIHLHTNLWLINVNPNRALGRVTKRLCLSAQNLSDLRHLREIDPQFYYAIICNIGIQKRLRLATQPRYRICIFILKDYLAGVPHCGAPRSCHTRSVLSAEPLRLNAAPE